MTKQEILDRIQNVLNQGVDTEDGHLDLLRHDLEMEMINKIQVMINKIQAKKQRKKQTL